MTYEELNHNERCDKVGKVSKTITKSVGSVKVVTSLNFESFQDFMKYENHYDVADDPKSETVIDQIINCEGVLNKEPKWIDHDGSDVS